MTAEGLRPVFTVAELLEAFRVLVDDATARAMVLEWLNCHAIRVEGDRVYPVIDDAEDWPELEESEEWEADDEWEDGGEPPVVITSNRPAEMTEAGSAFVAACAGALIAEVLTDSMYAFARSWLAVDELVSVVFPGVIERYEQPGVWVPAGLATDAERQAWVRMVREQMLGLGEGECVPRGRLVAWNGPSR